MTFDFDSIDFICVLLSVGGVLPRLAPMDDQRRDEWFILRIFLMLTCCTSLLTAGITYPCRTSGQSNTVFLVFDEDTPFDNFTEILDYYAGTLMTDCDPNAQHTTRFVYHHGLTAFCDGNLERHRKCVNDTAQNPSLFSNALATSTVIDWNLKLNTAIGELQEVNIMNYHQVKRIILITNIFDNRFVDAVIEWCKNPKKTLGYITESEENDSFLVFILPELNDSISLSRYKEMTMQGCRDFNLIGFTVNNITVGSVEPELTQAGKPIPFCKPPLFWKPYRLQPDWQPMQIRIFVSLSKHTTDEEAAAVSDFVKAFVADLPGDRCQPVIGNIHEGFRVTDEYFAVHFLAPDGTKRCVDCPHIDDQPGHHNLTISMVQCHQCVVDNLNVTGRLTELRSAESFGEVDCLGKQFFTDINDAFNEPVWAVRILYITNLIPLCIVEHTFTSEDPDRSFDMIFLNTSDAIFSQKEIQFYYSNVFHNGTHGDESDLGNHFFYLSQPIKQLQEPIWKRTIGICRNETASRPLTAATKVANDRTPKKSAIWYFIVFPVLVILILIGIAGVFFYRYMKKIKQPVDRSVGIYATSNLSGIFKESYKKWHIDRNALQIFHDEQLGRGKLIESREESIMISRKLSTRRANVDVAVKIPTVMQLYELGQLMHELEIMAQLDRHPNIIALHGVVDDAQLFCLVIELSSQNLLTFVTNLTEQTFSHRLAMSFARQIASAMAHIASKKFVHRDLAARNILLSDNLTAKVSDFGLCCRQDENSIFYMATSNQRLPIKWLAIEAFENLFSEKSDVWSFGLLLYEIYSLGQTPYADVPNDRLKQHLVDENRQETPKLAPDHIYKLMCDCWLAEPEQRPNFMHLHNIFEKYLTGSVEQYNYLNVIEEETVEDDNAGL